MAKFNFNLRNPNTEKPTSINLVVRYSNNKVVFYTRESIHPDCWNDNTQRACSTNETIAVKVKGSIVKKKKKKLTEHPEFNTRLDKLEQTAKDVFRCYQNDHNHREPSPAEYLNLLNAEVKGTKRGIPATFIEFTEYFIKETRRRLRLEGRQYPRNDISSSYEQTLNCIKDFARDKNKRIDFDTIDSEFHNEFVEYMQAIKTVTGANGKPVNKYGFSVNTIGKHIRNLKRILNEASSPEIAVNRFAYYKRFKVIREEPESIYLDEDELQALYDLDLSDNRRLDRVRDLFLVGCWTGLRFSDFTSIQAKDIRGDYIHIKTQKTSEKVVIPIHWTVKAIMNKYSNHENSLPPEISNVKMNLYLKELGQLMKCLHVHVDTSYSRAGKTVYVKRVKYELLTTHTARRSFATNMYKAGVPSISIMKVTGHRTERAFLRYIKVTPDEHAKIIMQYFQKQHKLRIV